MNRAAFSPLPLVAHGLAPHDRAAWLCALYPRIGELHDRYATLQGRVRAEWWLRDAEVEMLAALCAHRASLDEQAVNAESAKEQILFLFLLEQIATFLTSSEGSGAFDPGRDERTFSAHIAQLESSDADEDRANR